MFSKKITTKSVIALSDENISYVTLEKDLQGLFTITSFEKASLESGIIKKGEILQADLLEKIFSKIRLSISNKEVSLILPHEYFSFHTIVSYEPKKNQSPEAWFQEYKKKHIKEESWLSDYEFTYFAAVPEYKELHVAGIPNELFRSYQHVMKKSGFLLAECTSDVFILLSLAHHERDIISIFSDDALRLVECKNGIITNTKKFELSYHQYISDIEKILAVSKEQAEKIFNDYGLLRTHKDEAVYRKLHKSTSPLLQYLVHKKNLFDTHLSLVFLKKPILGMDDTLASFVGGNIKTFYPLTKKNGFREVLSIHKDESYSYIPHIVQALKFFQKK
jgi:hypothetical protein